MDSNKNLIMKLTGFCLVVLLVVSIAGCTSVNPATSPSSTASSSPSAVASTSAVQSTTKAQVSPQAPTQASPQPTNVQSYSFIGSAKSDVYHYPSCFEADKIKPENLVTFNSVADACAAGYRPCKVCHPPPCGSVSPTPSVVPTPTPQVKIATTIDSNNFFNADNTVTRGSPVTTWAFSVTAQERILCGVPLTAAIDGRPAGTLTPQASSGCFETANFGLSAQETAGLSAGTHTLTVSFAGDNTYQPTQQDFQIKVT